MSYLISSKNPLLVFAKLDDKKPHWLVALPLAYTSLILGQVIGYFARMPFESAINPVISPVWQNTISLFIRLIFANIFIIGCVFLWVHLYEKRPLSYLGFKKKNFAELYLKGILCGILMFSTVVAVMAVFQLVTWENGNPMLQGVKVLFPTLVLLSGFVIQGATEEILCRGWLMPILSARYNLSVGVFLSSSLFGMLHAFNQNVTVFAVVNIILVGVFFSLFALRQGSLWGACALHSVWNWLQGNFFGFQVSGQDVGPTIMNLKEIGPDWITGGAFGPEGGSVCSLVICIGIGTILYLNGNDIKKIKSIQL